MSSPPSGADMQPLIATDLQLVRLLRLASPMLPVGAFSYSQGLESAVQLGWVSDEASVRTWLGDVLMFSVGTMEAPVWCRLYRAFTAENVAALADWNDRLLSSRETQELRAESAQMGHSLRRLMEDSHEFGAGAMMALRAIREVAFATTFSVACADWHIAERAGLTAYLWTWLENQVAAAMKIVPLGQLAGQRLLAALQPQLVNVAQQALSADDEDLSSFAPGLAIASCLHETQYSRLFRS
jgi:urease accessory protein